MSPIGRVVVVALLLGLPAMSDGAAVRDGKRDYPHTAKCPARLVFKARYPKATLTFLASEDRDPDPNALLDQWIDDLIVVDQAYFDAHQVDFAQKQEEYGFDPNCYFLSPVTSVFDRGFAVPGTRTMPLFDRFENGGRGWTLINATVGVPKVGIAGEPNKALTLSDSTFVGVPGSKRSMASIQLTHLVPNLEYVVAFSWWARGFDAGQDILTIAFDDGTPGSGGPTTRSLRRPAALVVPRAARVPPR